MNSDLIISYIACTKATEMWFHAAHHVTKGAGFAGDHSLLYTKIYETLGKDYDSLVERGIGLYNDEKIACPILISKLTSKLLSNFDTPADKDDHDIASIGLYVLYHHLENLEIFYEKLSNTNNLSLGFDDLLQSFANIYEKYIYMLKQRLK
jgi:hypothetical protein